MRKVLAILFFSLPLFAQVRYGDQQTSVTSTLTITATGTGTGSVTSADGGINNCSSGGGTCSHAYNNGTSVTLTPTATGGSGFFWSFGTGGASVCSGSGACTFPISVVSTVSAVFTGSGGGSVPASPTFSVDLNSCSTFPAINMGQIRFWDTPSCQWPWFETANNVFDFSKLDTMLNLAVQNSVHTAQYGLARTPNWASSNTNLTVAGTLTSGTFSSGETIIQTGTSVSVTFVSYSSGTLTISQYTSGTANATGTWVGQTSGAILTPSAVPAGCSYFSNGGTSPGSKSGQCAPPTDLASDGTGTDLIFRNWVAAISVHVNQPGYVAGTGSFAGSPHAHIAYWEVWNEPFAVGKFWIGTYDQLIRMQQDAYCIIKGGAFTIGATGESCTTVRATVTSVASCCDGANGPADTTSSVIMPSYQPSGAAQAQCFLYCTPQNGTNQCGTSPLNCHASRGGAAQTDRINFHGKPGASAEAAIPTEVTAMQGVLQSAELAKPLDDTEAGFSASGWGSGAYLDANMQAGYIARMYLLFYYNGVANDVWYNCSAAQNCLGSATANTAYTQIYNWMVGSSSLSCSHVGTVYTCTMTLANAVAAAAIWDTSQSCSGTPSVCTFSTQTVNSAYLSYLDLYGNPKVTITSHQMQVGIMPRLAQAQ